MTVLTLNTAHELGHLLIRHASNDVEEQTTLLVQEVVEAWRKQNEGKLTSLQLVKAVVAAAWRIWKNQGDEKWEASQHDDLDVIDKLRELCEPHDGLNNDDEDLR